MKVYRVYDKDVKRFIKIGKRTNDIYVNRPLLIKSLKKHYDIQKVSDRFIVYEYDLVMKKEGN